MPTREGVSGEPALNPPQGLLLAHKCWVCRFTGAIYFDYQDYLRQLNGYRQRAWACKFTGKGGLTYEEALVEEAKHQGLLDQFPDCFEGPVARLVHHASLRLDELAARLTALFRDRYVPAEEVLGVRDGVPTACRVLEPLDASELDIDSEALSTTATVPPGDPEDEYRVEWLADGAEATLRRWQLSRKRPALSRPLVKAWLARSAEADAVPGGLKGIPCVWRASAALAAAHGLPAEPPPELAERIAKATQRKEQQARRAAEPRQAPEWGEGAGGDAAALAEWVPPDAGEIDDEEDEDYEDSEDDSRGPDERPQRKPAAPAESLEQVRARLPPGTVKRVLFEALEAAGEPGLGIPALVEAVQAAGVKTWEGARSANSSVAATCTHDAAFVRLGPGQITLRALRDNPRAARGAAAAAAARDRAADSDEERPASAARSATVDRNTLKCPRCHRTLHASGSPLLLCDTCPRAFHAECLGLALEGLPEDDWQCPKCVDKRLGGGRRGSAATGVRAAGASPAAAAAAAPAPESKPESKPEERSAREEKTLQRERLKEQARWAALHPVDDLETLGDLRRSLATADADARAAADELARVAQRAAAPEAAGVPGVEERLARLQKRAQRAAERTVELRLALEGPPQLQPSVSSETSKIALYDALAVVDFIAIFGGHFEAPSLTLLQLQQAAAWPLDSPHLAQLYCALLRCLLLEAMGMEGAVRSRARRWSRVLCERTWPEVLRRYLLASRAGLPVPASLTGLTAKSRLEPAGLDDNAACLAAAKLLETRPYHRLPPGLHLRVLMALCNDLTECGSLRAEISARVEEQGAMQAEFQQRQKEGRKRLRVEAVKLERGDKGTDPPQQQQQQQQQQQEEAEMRPSGAAAPTAAAEGALEREPVAGSAAAGPEAAAAAAAAAPPQTDAGPAGAAAAGLGQGAPAGDPGKGGSEQPEGEELQKGRRKRRYRTAAERKADATRAAAAMEAQERQFEAELQEREAALDEALDARAIRDEVLGEDRHWRRYWWFGGEQAVVVVEEPEGASLAAIKRPEQLNALLARLHRGGLREEALHAALEKRRDVLLASLGYHPVELDIERAPRPAAEKPPEEVAAGAEAETVRASAQLMLGYLDAMAAIPAAPSGASVEAWRARLEGVREFAELGRAALELEADLNTLGVGLPTSADDASLAGFTRKPRARAADDPEGEDAGEDAGAGEPAAGPPGPAAVPALPAAPPAPSAANAGAGGTQPQPAAAALPANGLPAGPDVGAAPAANGVRSNEESGGSDAQTAPEPIDEFEALPPVERITRLFQQAELVMPTDYVDALEELEASDSEISRNRRGGTLWRCARERRAWLRDARRALGSADASCAAYVTAVLIDRAQPLLRSLVRASKRAEREAAEWEAEADSSQEGTPAPAGRSAGKLKARGRRSVEGLARLPSRLSEGARRPRVKQENSDSEATETDEDAPIHRHSDRCYTCGEDGDLLLCEAPECPVAQHVACAGLDDAPASDWFCAEHRTRPSAKRARPRGGARASVERRGSLENGVAKKRRR